MATGVAPPPLEASVDARLSTLRAQAPQWKSQPYTMFRVPAYVRESNRTAYEPRMVSIGPYHHGSPSLRAMEDHKWRYLHDFLLRNATLGSSILIHEMRILEARARACYSERPDDVGSDDFVRMLLLDGCFVLEFFFKWHTKEPDALCDVGWGITLINADLLLLENQIPFFVLERLYHLVTAGGAQQGGRESLVNLLVEYIGDEEDPITIPSSTDEIHHLLHLYYESFVPKRSSSTAALASTTSSRSKHTAARAEVMIPRATEMSAAGVTFIRRTAAQDTYDVTFDAKRGVMEIPGVEVDDMRRPLLKNLIAFEQCHGGEEAAGVVASYVTLMGMLVRAAEDVELLRRRGVLDNLLADDDEAARFFSHLGDGGAMNYGGRHVFSGVYEDVQLYCGSWWHMNRAALRRDYFGSPWSAISFVVAALVVALTATQTYFTVFPRK